MTEARLIYYDDPEAIDGWRCPHCQEHLPLENVREHIRTSHDCPGCHLELYIVDALLAEQRRRRAN